MADDGAPCGPLEAGPHAESGRQALLLASQLLGVNWALVEQVGEERDAALAREEAVRKERDAALAYLVRGKNEDGLEIMLRVASKDGEVAVVRRVLAAEDADVDAVDEHECTALMYATSYNREEVVRTLLEAGAAPNATSHNSGCAALHLAFSAPIARLLLEAGADAGLRSDAGETALEFHERWAAKHLFKKHKRRSVAVVRAIREWQQQQQP